jgi:hypothetical protein
MEALHPLCTLAAWRASSNGTELRLSLHRDAGAILKIKRPGIPESRVEIDLGSVGETVDRFRAIGGDPQKFAAFINAYS